MSRTKKILSEYGYQPRKGRGQHFLVRERTLRSIVNAARIGPDETVVEIGPGPGNLTRHLLGAAARVIAVEVEHELCLMLKAELRADNLELIEADVLDLDFGNLAPAGKKLKVVANLPYNITTPVLFKFLESPNLFSELLLLVQAEVARRICAPPGKKPFGILAAQAQLWADCETALEVGPEAFTPKPRVQSALVRIAMRDRPRAEVADPAVYKKTVRAAFSHRRKTLANSLMGAGLSRERVTKALDRAGIEARRRAESLSIDEFAALANAMAEQGAFRA